MIKVKTQCKSCATHTTTEFLRPIEARSILGISEPTLNRYREEGFLQGHKFGRGYLYTQDQLESCARELRKEDQYKNMEIIYRG
jgi:hypothetical protein